MNFDKQHYPHILTISGVEYKAHRNIDENKVFIPYTKEPDVGAGDIITQKAGRRETSLRVCDVSFLEDSSLGIGTSHPHLLVMKVKNTISDSHEINNTGATFNIGSINGANVQIGNNNTLTTNVTIKELTESISQCDDPEAKSKLKEFLENSTVGSLIGTGVSALIANL